MLRKITIVIYTIICIALLGSTIDLLVNYENLEEETNVITRITKVKKTYGKHTSLNTRDYWYVYVEEDDGTELQVMSTSIEPRVVEGDGITYYRIKPYDTLVFTDKDKILTTIIFEPLLGLFFIYLIFVLPVLVCTQKEKPLERQNTNPQDNRPNY